MSIITLIFPDCELGGLKDITDALKEDKSAQDDTLKQVSCNTLCAFNLNLMQHLIFMLLIVKLITCGEKGCIPHCGGFPRTHVHRSAGY